MNYESLHRAFTKYCRSHGFRSGAAIVNAHGGTQGDLESVPESEWIALAKELNWRPEPIEHGRLGGNTRTDLPDSLSVSDPKFASFSKKAWDRFKNPPKRNPEE